MQELDMEQFPLVELQGEPREIGLLHGKILKNRINDSIQFYKKVFKKSDNEILEHAYHYKKVIRDAFPHYAEEIEAIAEGAEVDDGWVYALNARSEIITMFLTECTAVYSNQGLLAQNWDWAGALEELSVIMKITRTDGHQILMLTEPGIIGKIGFNSQNLGVTLNFLYAPGKLDGIPIHIMLRALLDQVTFENGISLVKNHAKGKGGNIIWASADGQYRNYEFANDEYYTIHDSQNMVHTNHYLGNSHLNSERDKLKSSIKRYSRAIELLNDDFGINDIKNLLADQYHSDLPICRRYMKDEELGDIGTISSIIMDLNALEFYYTPGNPFQNKYEKISID